MNQLTYNISMAAGLLACSLGAAMQWGWGVAAMVFGALTIALTLITLKLSD